MRFALAILGLTLAGTLNAAALDVRPASETEIEQALVGCWDQEPSFYDPPSSFAGVCFQADGSLFIGAFYGDHGADGGGEFEISGGKLYLTDDEPPGAWIFEVSELECDVIMSPGKAMKLTNCVGLGEDTGDAIADTSYEFRDD